jgi:hypothetical protein
MIVYSNKIIRFILEIKSLIRKILTEEVGVVVSKNRFFDSNTEFSYPIAVVIYNDRTMLGYFDAFFYELGFHERLMYTGKDTLCNVIRHELAHYMLFIMGKGEKEPHGPAFREFCLSKNWKEEVYGATVCLEEENREASKEESAIFRKIKKLMALAGSANQNEAEQATIKSQQLLLKYNIETSYLDEDAEEKMVLKRILKQKRKDAKIRALARILETFLVSCVFSRHGQYLYLEILGTAVNVEVAEYVSIVLGREFDSLWALAQKQAHLKGMLAKNSFFLGIARGYCNKINNLKRGYTEEVTNALVVFENKLLEYKSLVYDRLVASTSRGSCCRSSLALGELMGGKLNIKPGLAGSVKSSGKNISYQKS